MVTSPANMADTASADRSAADVILFIWFSFLVVLLRCFALHAAMPEGVNLVQVVLESSSSEIAERDMDSISAMEVIPARIISTPFWSMGWKPPSMAADMS